MNDKVIEKYLDINKSLGLNKEIINPADLGDMEQADIDNLLKPNQEILNTVIGGPKCPLEQKEKIYNFVLVKQNGETILLNEKTYQQMYECVKKLYVQVSVYQKVQVITPRTEIDIDHIY